MCMVQVLSVHFSGYYCFQSLDLLQIHCTPLWLSLFVVIPGIISGSELWAQYCVNTISRFTSLADRRCGNPCACSILPSLDIAENLRVVCKAGKGRQLDLPLTYIYMSLSLNGIFNKFLAIIL